MMLNIKNGIQATANPTTGKMDVFLLKDGREIASTQIEIKEASSIAALVLQTAKTAHEMTGKPMPDTEGKVVPFTSIAPSALNVGPSHIQGCESLILHFGLTTLGIAIPRAALLSLGQRLMALGTEGSAHH